MSSAHDLGVIGDQRIVVSRKEVAQYQAYGHMACHWTAVERIDFDDEYEIPVLLDIYERYWSLGE